MRNVFIGIISIALTASVLAAVFHGEKAHADSSFVETLQPGLDGGTSAVTSKFYNDQQVRVDCEGFDVRYKACVPGTCVAGGTDARIFADKPEDICMPPSNSDPSKSKSIISVFRAFDGGVPSCKFFLVSPKTSTCLR